MDAISCLAVAHEYNLPAATECWRQQVLKSAKELTKEWGLPSGQANREAAIRQLAELPPDGAVLLLADTLHLAGREAKEVRKQADLAKRYKCRATAYQEAVEEHVSDFVNAQRIRR